MNRFKNIYVIIPFENYRQVNIANEHHHYRSTIDDFGDFFHKLREKIDVYKFEKIIFILNRIFETTILKKKNCQHLRQIYYCCGALIIYYFRRVLPDEMLCNFLQILDVKQYIERITFSNSNGRFITRYGIIFGFSGKF